MVVNGVVLWNTARVTHPSTPHSRFVHDWSAEVEKVVNPVILDDRKYFPNLILAENICRNSRYFGRFFILFCTWNFLLFWQKIFMSISFIIEEIRTKKFLSTQHHNKDIWFKQKIFSAKWCNIQRRISRQDRKYFLSKIRTCQKIMSVNISKIDKQWQHLRDNT